MPLNIVTIVSKVTMVTMGVLSGVMVSVLVIEPTVCGFKRS
jgi:hypothetical protein